MNVLIAVASKHGGTTEIGEAIADELRQMGLTTTFHRIDGVVDPDGYDAVVLGSAVYMGDWHKEARAFVKRNLAQLRTVPVWMFSSGPLGDEEPKPNDDLLKVEQIAETINARGHRIFRGRLRREDLGLGERMVASVVHAPYGDFREWAEIRAWAHELGTQLITHSVPDGAAAIHGIGPV